MTEYRYQGDHTPTIYPSYQHPEQDGVLVVIPGQVVDFGDASPPPDGKWYDISSGEPYLGPVTSVEAASEPGDEAQEANPAQGDAEDQED